MFDWNLGCASDPCTLGCEATNGFLSDPFLYVLSAFISSFFQVTLVGSTSILALARNRDGSGQSLRGRILRGASQRFASIVKTSGDELGNG